MSGADRFERQSQIIDSAAQQKLSSSTVAVAGMGVGASVALQLGLMGVGGLRISDSDTVSVSNLNRHPLATLADVGRPKTSVVADHLRALDPAMVVDVCGGVLRYVWHEFVGGVDVIVDEIDSIVGKFALRRAARDAGVPVVSGTDLGDSGVLLSVERYDLDRTLEPFGGRVRESDPPAVILETLYRGYCTQRFWRMVEGQSSGFQQVGTTMAVGGALTARLVRDLLLGHSFASGDYFFSLDAWQVAGVLR